MAIPIVYNLRNLVVRKTTTAMTALGIALTVAVLVADLALVNGLREVFRHSGNPLHILVLRKGSNSELASSVNREVYQNLREQTAVAKNSAGQPMASPEIVTSINVPSSRSARGITVTLRGLTPVGIEMRHVGIEQGRWFQPGQREIIVGKSTAQHSSRAGIGTTRRFGKGEWLVVGVMDGHGSALSSEIWGDFNQISSDFNRSDSPSSVLLRVADAAAVPGFINFINEDRALKASAISERAYYDRQTVAGAPLQFLGIFVAIIMAAGSSVAAMNTMYAAVSRRSVEIGTLRVLGFSQGSILLSFLIESLLLSLVGGLLGCLIALPLNYFRTGVGNMITFSEIDFQFRVGLGAVLAGMAFAFVMGAIGGLFPAHGASRREIVDALRGA
jgi:putative ABC transport system permease protein